jgi:hypothetical protein
VSEEGALMAVVHRIMPQSRLASLLLPLVAALAVAAIVGALLWWLFVRPVQIEQRARQAEVNATVQDGATKAASDALRITVDVNQAKRAIDDQTKVNQDAIYSAQGASAPVDPAVLDALNSALCMRRAYQSDRDCAAVRAAGRGVGAAQPDRGGGAADPR